MTRGRPRKSDPDDVLGKALELFWKNGYAGTSMNDVSAYTGMAKPGLYATFGNKDALYQKALLKYLKSYGDEAGAVFVSSQDVISGAVRTLLLAGLRLSEDGVPHHGCFLLNTVIETTGPETEVGQLSRKLMAERRVMLEAKLAQAQQAGELDPAADPSDLASYVSGLMMGLAAMISEGADRPEIERFVDRGLLALPVTDKAQVA